MVSRMASWFTRPVCDPHYFKPNTCFTTNLWPSLTQGEKTQRCNNVGCFVKHCIQHNASKMCTSPWLRCLAHVSWQRHTEGHYVWAKGVSCWKMWVKQALLYKTGMVGNSIQSLFKLIRLSMSVKRQEKTTPGSATCFFWSKDSWNWVCISNSHQIITKPKLQRQSEWRQKAKNKLSLSTLLTCLRTKTTQKDIRSGNIALPYHRDYSHPHQGNGR